MQMISLGDKNKYVLTLKINLNKYFGCNLPLTEEFDEETDKVVRDFQKSKKILVDGIVGAGQTWPALLGRNLNWVFIHTADCFLNTTPEAIMNYDRQTWGLVGYHYLYKADGTEVSCQLISLMTAGVLGMNSDSIHLSGIYGRAQEPFNNHVNPNVVAKRTYKLTGNVVNVDNHTEEQEKSMIKRVNALLKQYPHLIILGHNQAPMFKANGKLCPIFDTREFLERNGIPKDNIYYQDTWGVLKFIKTGIW